MESKSEFYERLATPGEVKKTKPDRVTPPEAREKENRPPLSTTIQQGRPQLDQHPSGGSILRRNLRGKPVPRISVKQASFGRGLVDVVQTTHGMKPLQPIDAAPDSIAQGTITSDVLSRADGQKHAITKSVIERAKKQNGRRK